MTVSGQYDLSSEDKMTFVSGRYDRSSQDDMTVRLRTK